MSQTFGRRTPAGGSWAPLPPEPALVTATAATREPAAVDPEFEAWSRARAKTRWKIWALAGLMVLGGPLCFLLPQPFGMLASVGLVVAFASGVIVRRRGTKADAV